MSLAFRREEGGGCDIIDDGDDGDDVKGVEVVVVNRLVGFTDDDDDGDDTALNLVTGKLSRFFAVAVSVVVLDIEDDGDGDDDTAYTHQSSRPIS